MKPAEGRVEEAAYSHPFVSAHETDATSQSVILRKIMTFQISQYTLHENWCLVPEFVSIALLQKTTKAL